MKIDEIKLIAMDTMYSSIPKVKDNYHGILEDLTEQFFIVKNGDYISIAKNFFEHQDFKNNIKHGELADITIHGLYYDAWSCGENLENFIYTIDNYD